MAKHPHASHRPEAIIGPMGDAADAAMTVAALLSVLSACTPEGGIVRLDTGGAFCEYT